MLRPELRVAVKRCLYRSRSFSLTPSGRWRSSWSAKAEKWFKPAKGQFQIFQKSGADLLEYQPDFVAETSNLIYVLEPKARNEMDGADVAISREGIGSQALSE